jgi:tetratricopeptide (TPR) repeat protein/ferredoxin
MRRPGPPIAVIAPEPESPRSGKVRASTMGRWRALVLIAVHVLIGLHIVHWLTSGETMTPVEPSEAMAFSRSSIVNAGLIFFAATVLLTAVFGRFFCGWACHVLALQDFCRYLMLKIGIVPRPLKTRVLMWVPALAFVYMFLWPAAYRLWIGDSFAVRGMELTTSQFWATFPGWIIGGLTLIVCGFACVYFLGAKGFCTYACPYGALFGAVDRVAPMRIRVTDACSQCGHCTAVCSSNVRVHEEVRDYAMVVSPGCMKCMDCVSVCPTNALYYGAGPAAIGARPRERKDGRPRRPARAPRWRDEIVLATSFAAAFLIVRGLYGLVPFLMSLGVAAIIAFLVLTALRVATEADVERPGLRLKRGGRLLPAGRAFVAAMTLLAAALAFAAVLRSQAFLGERAFDDTGRLRQALLAAPGQLPALGDDAAAVVADGIARLERVEAWGGLPTFGNAARLAWLHTLSGDDHSAAVHAGRALARGELAAEMHELRAHLALRAGDVEGARRAWQQAIDARPDLVQPYLSLGLNLARAGDLGAAQQVFDHGAATAYDSAVLHYNAALTRAMSGQGEAAIEGFRRALALRPAYREARENLAGVLASLGRFDESIAEFRIALQQAPDDTATRFLLARALIARGERDAAAAELREILRLDPTHADAWSMLQGMQGGVP